MHLVPQIGEEAIQRREEEARRRSDFLLALKELNGDAKVGQFEIARMCGVRVTIVSQWLKASEWNHYDLPAQARLEPLTLMFRTETRARGIEPFCEEE